MFHHRLTSTIKSIMRLFSAYKKTIAYGLMAIMMSSTLAGCNGKIYAALFDDNSSMLYMLIGLQNSIDTITIETVTPMPVANGIDVQYQVVAHLKSGKTRTITKPSELEKIIWSSDDPTIATISDTGLAEGVIDNYIITPAEATTIRASYRGFDADTIITIEDAELTNIIVTCEDPDLSIANGTSTQFTATGVFSNGQNYNITADDNVQWTSSLPLIVSIDDATGIATGDDPGTSTIEAEWTGAGLNDTDSEDLTVTNAVLTSITLSGPNSAASGNDVDFTATGHFSDGSTQDMTDQFDWSSSNTSIATVDENGHVITSDTTTGTVTIYARYPEGGPYTVTGSASFEVTTAELVTIEVTAEDDKISIAKGVYLNYTATGTYTNGTTPDITTQVTWASDDTDTVTISNLVGTEGRAFGKAVGGPVTITASLDGKSDTASLSVTAAELVSLTVTPATDSIGVHGTSSLMAEGLYTDGTTTDHTNDAAWSSENNTIASVDQSGDVTGQSSGGPVTITAQYGGETGSSEITVTAATLVRVEVRPPDVTLMHAASGNTQQFTATAVFSDNTTNDVTEAASWQSSNGGAATVSNTSGSKGLATTVAAGATTIQATYDAIPGTASLTVESATLAYIIITADETVIAKGTKLQYTATGVYTDNSTQDLTAQAVWSSDDETYVTISNAAGQEGLATGVLQGGPVTITASFDGESGTAELSVTNETIQSLTIFPKDPTAYVIAYGTTQQFSATGSFTDGSEQDLTSQVDWSSSLVSVATIDNTGLATTDIIEGDTVITAKYPKGCTTTCTQDQTTLRVVALTLQSITVTPSSQTTWVGQAIQYYATGTFSDGSVTAVRDITSLVLWTTDSSSVALMSNDSGTKGLLSATGAGTTTVRAKWGTSVEGSTGITVTATDTDSPTILEARLLPGGLNRVEVTFSEAMDYTAVTTAAAYNIVLEADVAGVCSDNSNFASSPGISVSSVTPINQSKYILQLSSGTIAAQYILLGDKTVLDDASGNALGCDNFTNFDGDDTVDPYILSVVNSTPTAITVTFSEKMTNDGSANAANLASNYTLAENPSDGNPANNVTITSVTNVNDTVFILNLDMSAQSIQYKLTAGTNVTDDSANNNAMGTPNWLTFDGNEQLKVVSAQSTGYYTIKVAFSKPVRAGTVGSFPYTSECSGAADCHTKYKLFPRNSSDLSPLGDITSAVRGTGSETNTVTLTHATTQYGLSYTVVAANALDSDGFTNGSVKIESEASATDYVQASPKDRVTFIGSGDVIDRIDEGSIFEDPFGDGSIFTWSFVYGNKVYLGTNDHNNAAFRFDADGSNSVLVTFDIETGYTQACSSSTGFGYTSAGETCASTEGFNNEYGVVGFNAGTITISATNYEILMLGPLKDGVTDGYFTQDLDTEIDWKPFNFAGTGGGNTDSIQTTYAYGTNMFYSASSDQGTQAPVVCRIPFTGASGGTLTMGTPVDMALRSVNYIGKNAGSYDNYKGTAEVIGVDAMISFNNRLYAANNGGLVYASDYTDMQPETRSHPYIFRPNDGDGVLETTPTEETLVLPLGAAGLGKVSPGEHGVPKLLEYNGNLYMARNVASTSARHTSIRGELWKCVPGSTGGATTCEPADWTRIISGSETDLPIGTNAISLLQNNGTGKLYVGFDNPNTGVGQGASVWRIESTNPSATSGTMASTGWARQGLPGLNNSHIKFFSSATINDGTYDFIYLTAGDDANAIRVYRQRE